MPIITSRSCPGACTFCSVHMLSGKKWRKRDPIKVVDEIEDLITRWGYETVSVFDDACNVLPDRLIRICQEILRRQLEMKLTFPGGLIINYITRDLLYWMKKAGCISLSLPVEHANDIIRNEIIKKKLSFERIMEVLQWCRELKLLALVNVVIGMPGETEETIKDIIKFVRDNIRYISSLSVYIATPYPGTEFYDMCLEKGYLTGQEDNEFLDFDLYTGHIKTETMTHTRILEYKQLIEKTFLELKGSYFPVDYIRKAIRKPDKDTIDYIENVYFQCY